MFFFSKFPYAEDFISEHVEFDMRNADEPGFTTLEAKFPQYEDFPTIQVSFENNNPESKETAVQLFDELIVYRWLSIKHGSV